MDVQIRLSKPEDLENILKLQADSLRGLSPNYNLSQIESLIKNQRLARIQINEVILVAEYKHEIIGFASLLNQQSRIGGIYVHPNFVRQGIGTQMLDAIEEMARQNKYKFIDVMSSSSSVDFYQKNGYQIIRESDFYCEDNVRITCINLEKQLMNLTDMEKWCLWIKNLFF
ncbi:GNAT family N-acetyltransferase [Anabaena cylindrica UHCC 0172]|uniref:GNAT family N-acetyltransferase n=1 Tax=Anabaena cylindrica TaxID=1165 RepID=UPI002B1F3F8C|nr:GNAT family N-acetyltransferase [Anabaena cylindrica]MEA5554809.1 GNAT family N-acetyltransferase [Anabaena cylindrica UHCC 0172]